LCSQGLYGGLYGGFDCLLSILGLLSKDLKCGFSEDFFSEDSSFFCINSSFFCVEKVANSSCSFISFFSSSCIISSTSISNSSSFEGENHNQLKNHEDLPSSSDFKTFAGSDLVFIILDSFFLINSFICSKFFSETVTTFAVIGLSITFS